MPVPLVILLIYVELQHKRLSGAGKQVAPIHKQVYGIKLFKEFIVRITVTNNTEKSAVLLYRKPLPSITLAIWLRKACQVRIEDLLNHNKVVAYIAPYSIIAAAISVTPGVEINRTFYA